jgi:beta-glucosidase
LMACAKHFAAYGAAIGGRDYNSADMSLRTLWEVYLPPFKAAKDAGVATFMNSFNDINGIPASGNAYLQHDILKGIWNFDGFVVSDWGSVGEMIQHGFVKDKYEAAEVAIKAGNDMDMESRSYTENLAKLVSDGRVPVEMIDNAVRRILKKKFEMGLFDDPFRFSNAEREKNTMNKPEYQAAARDIARKSIVLLKNTDHLLPLSENLKSIALIGPLVKAKKDLKGFWAIDMGDEKDIISLYEGIEKQAGNSRLLYARGCAIDDTSEASFDEAVQTALQGDMVVMAMGEKANMTGEAKSKSNIHLPGVQEKLIQAVVSTGKPVVVILMAGRPMVFNWTAEHVPSILYAWWLGNQAGNAIADVLFGSYNPAGKLPITFPRSEGQIPIYYNCLNTGRPAGNEKDLNYRSAYIDLPNSPQYAFGHGLSYTSFAYGNLKFSRKEIHSNDSVIVTFDLKNSGHYAGEEVVQLYLRDLVAQPVRPVKELKDFQKVMLRPGESKTLTFTIDRDKLSFYNENLEWIAQPGEFKVMIGSASDDIRLEGIINYE